MTPDTPRSVLFVVENLPVPLDRRVWLEATTLKRAGYEVSVICPMGRGWDLPYEVIDGIHIHRHPMPPEAHSGALAYAREYGAAIYHWFRLAKHVHRNRGFDVIHGCNPPDLVWLLALRWRPWGVRYVFDHHDVCPELYEAKFGSTGWMWKLMCVLERINFAFAHVSIATNESFRALAKDRGGMRDEDVFVVRSAPKIDVFRPGPGDPSYRKAETMLGWVGVIGQQEGLDLMAEAVGHLVAEGRDVHALIVGFGPHLDAVKADVAARGLQDRFTFTGALYGDDMLAALNAVDIGVSCDPKNAMNDISTMNKVMEFMTLAKPLVQFDLTEGRASAGDAARYAEDNDPAALAREIAWLMDHPEAARAMGERGRARVLDRLSWEHSVPHLLAAHARVAEKAGKPVPEVPQGA
ncbi:glycosyltransferase family 4 protein [Jannaschia sp. Os4]|uniref:glycosyltransferase family 4 protein n=1 Tax=Jannaschia sp. Os4 TaxID=2807617 RepID=UPI0019394B3A|nr:glycosyltransferase family 4 protein [Jannaschia sp. Os4]MBM2575137.1 glycosyltransferase family 4 protein [Jannaschia sp. Os4]